MGINKREIKGYKGDMRRYRENRGEIKENGREMGKNMGKIEEK